MKRLTAVALLLALTSTAHAQDTIPSIMRRAGEIDITAHLHAALAVAGDPSTEGSDYAALEAEMFARMNWGEEEITWFRSTYGPDSMFGAQEDYIYAVAALYAQLDAADAP